MRTRFHRFLLLLLMLVLPLQTWASTAVPACMMAQAGMPLASADAAPMGMDDVMAASCHEAPRSDTPEPHHCAHCAACYLAAFALPIPAFAAPLVEILPAGFLPAPIVTFSGFIADGPERPPRASLS